jgi:hypothetical protein
MGHFFGFFDLALTFLDVDVAQIRLTGSRNTESST